MPHAVQLTALRWPTRWPPTFAARGRRMATPGPYSPDARDAGRRALRLQAVRLLAHADGGAAAARFSRRPTT